jgi:signal transduction histidine kinase
MRRVEQQRAALQFEAREATTSERRRIAADLHDGVFQELTAASLAVSGAARTLDDERAAGPDTVEALDGAAQRVRDSVEALRTLVTSFYPPELEERGFAASLDHLAGLARTHGVAAEVVVPVELSAPPETQALLYRVAQEAVRNALNHSRPTLVSLRAGEDASGHWLEVEDDGGGFDLSDPVPHGHMGLRSLRDLVSGAGGRLTVSACPGEGCVVRAELPAAAVREVRI